MNSARPNILSIKGRFASTGCKDIEIRIFDCVAKTQILELFICKVVIKETWENESKMFG